MMTESLKSRAKSKKKHINGDASLFIYIILTILLLLQALPLSTMFINSFRKDTSIKAAPIGFPDVFSFKNYADTWIIGEYGKAFLNSFIVGFSVIIIVVITAGLAAYAMTKLELPRKNFFTGYFLMVMAIPTFLYIIPVYYTFNSLQLTNSIPGIIIIYSANQIPFNLLLIRTYLIGIPKEIEEAARVDGCNEVTAFLKITFPLAKPIFLTVAILIFVHTWNEFLWANTFLVQDPVRTVSLRFIKFTGEHTKDLAKVFTAGCISVSPIVILYLLMQRQFIEGITAGGVKA